MTERHESSCSVYNMPAYPNGPCNCKYRRRNMVRSLKFRHWLALAAIPLILVSVPVVFIAGWQIAAIFSSSGLIAVSIASLMTPEGVDVGNEALDKAVEAIRMSDQ